MKLLKYILSIALFSSVFIAADSQDTVYYYGSNYRPLQTMNGARYMQQIRKKGEKRYVIKFLTRENNQWLWVENQKIKKVGNNEQLVVTKGSSFFGKRMSREFEKQDTLYAFREISRGEIVREGAASSLIPMHLEGEVREYYSGGKMKSTSFYKNNQLVSNENWLRDGTKYIDNIFYSVDTIPEYLLGNRFFKNHILTGLKFSKYDYTEVNEVIVLGWVITAEGKLTDVQKVSGKTVTLPNILIKLVETLPGDWTPAILDGKPVNYFMTIPFNFEIQRRYFQKIELRDGLLFWD